MKETRMQHVEQWAAFVREHADAEWSRLQKELIDSQIENAQRVNLTKEQVEHIRGSHLPKRAP